MSDIIEQVKDAATPEEMRAEIFRLSFHDALVRAVTDAANYSGMNAEDRYTLLAYHTLKERCLAQSLVMQYAMTTVNPMLVPK